LLSHRGFSITQTYLSALPIFLTYVEYFFYILEEEIECNSMGVDIALYMQSKVRKKI
jgi:hypothetical protein